MASGYPSSLDSFATNKGKTTDEDTGTPTGGVAGDHAGHHNDLADAINKIETELGTNPSGSHSTVATALSSALQARQATHAPDQTIAAYTGTALNLVSLPCPPLDPGVTKMMFHASVELTPGAGVTYLGPSINEVDSGGAYIGNLGFWNIDRPAIGDRFVFTGNWLYDVGDGLSGPPPDVDLGDGSGRYIGLQLSSVGGTCNAYSAILQIVSGPIELIPPYGS